MNKVLRILWGIFRRVGFGRFLSDAAFTRIMYRCYMGRKLDLTNPKDFNQKIQWLKLYYRNPYYVTCADKYAVREYVRRRVGKEFLNNCIGVYERVEDVDFDALPPRFVLKATHGSGWNIVCADKSRFDRDMAIRNMRKWLKCDFSKVGREWQYHEIPPRIVCESFMEESDGSPLMDYKLFTFKGVTRYIAVEFDKQDGRHFINFYDADGRFQSDKHLDAPCDETAIQLPGCLEEMKALAKKLAGNFPMCRVDFYVLDGEKVVFGELTFTPGKGCNAFVPQSFCEELGNYIDLPERMVGP